MVVFGQQWLYSGKSCFILAMWLFSGKVVVFGESGCIRAKWLYSGKSGSIQEKVIVFKQSG